MCVMLVCDTQLNKLLYTSIFDPLKYNDSYKYYKDYKLAFLSVQLLSYSLSTVQTEDTYLVRKQKVLMRVTLFVNDIGYF